MRDLERTGLTPIDSILPTDQETTMSLEQARQILQLVVSTDERSITKPTYLDNIGDFTTQQIRDAALMVAVNVMSLHKDSNDSDIEKTTKTTPDNKATLILQKRYYNGQPSDPAKGIYLELIGGKYVLIQSQFPLVEPTYSDRPSVFYRDHRIPQKQVSLRDIIDGGPFGEDDKFLTGDFQHIFRGWRWLFANMLNWDKPDLIMPEQLNHVALNPSTTMHP